MNKHFTGMKNLKMKGDLFDYLRWTLLLGKYFGFIPITNLEFSGEIPRFTWKSICAFLYAINFTILLFMVVIQMYGFLCSPFNLIKMNGIIFIIIYLILSVLFFRFCQRFKCFLTEIKALEKLLPPTWKPRSSVRFVNRVMVIMISLGLLEQIIYLIYSMYLTNTCFRLEGDSGWYIKSYYEISFGWYFDYFPFSYAVSIIFQIVKTQAGFMWFYGDLFIMSISIYLRNRFEDFNRLIMDEKNMFTKSFKPSWSELQVHYTRLSKLVAIFDQNFNPIVFISYTSNLYFVCLNLYIILNNLTEVNLNQTNDCPAQHSKDTLILIFKVYKSLSLISRTAFLSYTASEVHVASRKSLIVMHSTPISAFNGDMQRLMTQIYYSKLGISGLNFFKITRGMILEMVAKLITYELVVVQF